jgi:hypothetical protein
MKNMKNWAIHERFPGNGPDGAPFRAHALRQGLTYSFSGTASGCCVICLKGMLWLTRENDHEDYILGEASSWVSKCPGLVVIEALRDSSLRILDLQEAHLGKEMDKEAL